MSLRKKGFTFAVAGGVPYRTIESSELERIRTIRRDRIEKHPNPDFRISVVPDSDVWIVRLTDMFHRIKTASEQGTNIALILGNPNPRYSHLAHMLNVFEVDCSRLYVFNMDEWADEDGNTAPESYPQGFMRAMKRNFYYKLDPKIRPPEDHIQGPTTGNVSYYGKMMEDVGGVDVCYSGPGWTGHIAFIDPDVPEFSNDLEEWKSQGTRIVTLNLLTIAQNSLHSSFGRSGALSWVPPKAATIGPADVIAARHRCDTHSLVTAGTSVSWQRFTTRLCLHGPVTPQVPGSLLQTLRTDVLVSETAAMDIEPNWDEGY